MGKKELDIKNVLLIMQTALATIVFAVSIGYIFEKSYLLFLECILTLLIFLLAYNNYKYFKKKLVTQLLLILGVILIIGVII